MVPWWVDSRHVAQVVVVSMSRTAICTAAHDATYVSCSKGMLHRRIQACVQAGKQAKVSCCVVSYGEHYTTRSSTTYVCTGVMIECTTSAPVSCMGLVHSESQGNTPLAYGLPNWLSSLSHASHLSVLWHACDHGPWNQSPSIQISKVFVP